MRLPWIIFAIAVLAVLEGLGWVTWRALSLERREADARVAAVEQQRFSDSVRVALWRMETELTPLIAVESSRPAGQYASFVEAGGGVVVASPLLEPPGPFVKLHYERLADGTLRSPQAPVGAERERAAGVIESEFLMLGQQRLGELRAVLDGAGAKVAFVDQDAEPVAVVATPVPVVALEQSGDVDQLARQQVAADLSMNRNAVQQRSRMSVGAPASKAAAEMRREAAAESVADVAGVAAFGRSARVEAMPGPLVPRWVDGELVLERRAVRDGVEVTQGVWIDWAALEARLLAVATPLVPGARLVAEGNATTRLATLPIVLEAGAGPVAKVTPFWSFVLANPSPTHAVLVVTWLAVLGAIGAIGFVLHKAMDLSERRGRFVSAVTHELRTPLTSFALSTELLASGRLPEEARQRHVAGLASESRRLSAIVESVLSYAGLGKTPAGHEVVTVGELMERVRPALQKSAAGVEFAVSIAEAARGLRVRVDVGAMERVLVNLVDNAVKHGRPPVRVEVGVEGKRVRVAVRDAGGGLPAELAARGGRAAFEPYRRGASENPGLGLGLAIARALARLHGGDVVYDGGFVVELPGVGDDAVTR